jgi:hypothetical protein
MQAALSPRVRFAAAAADVLTRPLLLWALAAVFAVRMAVLAVLAPDRPDTRVFLAAGRTLVHDPAHLYTWAASWMARTGTIPPPGQGFIEPPAAAYLAAPFAMLAGAAASALWTLADAAAAVVGLALLYRALRPRGWARPLYWLIAAYFPPLFAEVDAGQIGGWLLLLGVVSILQAQRRPVLAGLAAATGASVKFYPAGMLAGAGPRLRYWLAVAVGTPALLLLSFIPLGGGGPFFYVARVLYPAALHSTYQDCAIDSVHTLFSRTVGGESYFLPGTAGLVRVTLPLHLPLLASVLTLATTLGLVAGCFWAARRSGWHPLYGLCLGFGLGALVPAEVNPYQFLPLLPLVLLVAMRALEADRPRVVLALGAALLGFVRQPCDLPFPNLWTLAGLAVYLICLWENGVFRTEPAAEEGIDGAQRSSQLHVDRPRHLEGAQRPR